MKKRIFLLAGIFLMGCSTMEKPIETKPKQIRIVREVSETDRDVLIAVGQGDFETLNKFIKQGVVLNKVYGMTNKSLAHAAVTSKNLKMLKLIAEHGVNLDEKDSFNMTPLALAVESNQVDLAHFLLEKGANPNVRDYFRTPLILKVVESNYEEMLYLLMKYKSCPLGNGFMDKNYSNITTTNQVLKEQFDNYVKVYKKTISNEIPKSWQNEDLEELN